jgi:glucose/arabinose dehydrogenase
VENFPDPAGYEWQVVVDGMARPLDLLSPPGDQQRIFIVEQGGVIRILQDGALLDTPFLDISAKVKREGNEQGLLGLAFHPQFAENGYLYVNYTGQTGVGDTVIARYSLLDGDPNQADPNSEVVLLTVAQPYANHNGGGMVFGPDGYLYMSLGDGGSAGDPQGNAQNLDTYLGKLLRVDVDGDEPYAIPASNPFSAGGGLPEIFAYGLRNPWRFSFDRATGDLYIADVGQNAWEEIDFQPAGAPGGWNYGWDYLEGTHAFEGQPPEGALLAAPVFEYQHGIGCSVTGGYVYRGTALPEFNGIYLFSDYCSGRVWGLLQAADGSWMNKELFQTGWNVSSFGLDAQGELYLIDQSGGTVYKLVRK